MRAALLCLLLCGILPTVLLAQDVPVRINVSTDSLRPIGGANISISAGTDRAIKATTDAAGISTVRLKPATSYFIDISAPGFAVFSGTLYADSSHAAFSYKLQKSQSLKGATVTATRSMMRQEGDVTVIDPEQLALAATSGYEVLEKTPGIIADQDGNFYLSSATPAVIYINGREMRMSAADVAAMLKALPPHSILRIEVLRTPSAKFDASGGGGIINVVLKKGVKLGMTGSVNAGIQQGVYGNQNLGANISYGDGDISTYANLSVARRGSMEQINSTRVLSPDTLLSQDAGTVYSGDNVFFSYGIDKDVKEQWTLSYDGRASGNWSANQTHNENIISQKSNGMTAGRSLTDIDYTGSNWNLYQGAESKYKIDTSGSEWTSSLTWNGTFVNNGQDIISRSVQPAMDKLSNNGEVMTQRHMIAFQSDVKYKLLRNLILEGGIKSTVVSFRHNSDYTLSYRTTTAIDPLRTTTYRYNENINAAYGQATRQWGDVILKGGLRIENTNMDGAQVRPGDTSFSIRRTDLFPYIYLSKPIMKMLGFELRGYIVYRRTIQRPTYDYLNPFQRFIDQYLYESGNPNLRPQFTDNYEFNICADEHPVFAVGINDAKDIYANVMYESEINPAIALRTWDNLGKSREYYVRAMGGVPPGGAYFGIIGGQYSLNSYDGYYNGAPLQYSREGFSFFTYHNLKLGKQTNIVVNGFMRLKGLMQFYELGSFGALNASINRHFFNRKLTVTLSAQDIFFTNRYDATIDQGGITGSIFRYNDSQRFGINVRYNFGFRRRDEEHSMPGQHDVERGAE